jgi:hypothetical protein
MTMRSSIMSASLWDPSMKTLAALGFLAEVIHLLNSLFVKYRWEYWPVNSWLDSYVFHTLMFLVFGRYFRDYSLEDAILFAISRVVAEGYLPTSLGGLMELKTHEEAFGGSFQDCFWLSVTFGVTLTLTLCILMRDKVFHPWYWFQVAFAFPTTFLMASRYLYVKSNLFYWISHLANFVSFNPALTAVVLGYTGRPAKHKEAKSL